MLAGRGPGRDHPGHQAVRPAAGIVVPPRPQGDLAGRGSRPPGRPGPADPGDGYDQRMRFAKGHGTENDFVILPDPDDLFGLSATLAARLCDRHAGLGADGVLRVVRTAAITAASAAAARAGTPDSAERSGSAEWFMDHRNADGSVAEMCGNGLRVFARFLLDHGMAEGPAFTVATRAGLRRGPPGVAGGGAGSSGAAASPRTWAPLRCSARAEPCPAAWSWTGCGYPSATRTWRAWWMPRWTSSISPRRPSLTPGSSRRERTSSWSR